MRFSNLREEIFFVATDYIKYDTAHNIRQVLSGLEKEKLPERLAHGIYLHTNESYLQNIIGKIFIKPVPYIFNLPVCQ
ncbi:DUF6088 family protein [Myroides sp. LJL119]